jgi:NAD(P)-dependent dehydrogenase (short-subunit alcohol dehydrogenase family)
MLHAVVSGAGSGVGQGVALALVQRGWTVSLLGRRGEALKQTVALAGSLGSKMDTYPVDLAREAEVSKVVGAILVKFPEVQALVNAAGTNIPRRSLAELSRTDWKAVLDTNLNGTYYLVSELLPVMRRQGGGSIINLVSDAGIRANAKAGPSYVASKFAVSGLTQAINCEEQKNGIRATSIFPGDIDTPLLDKRPVPPKAEARVNMLQVADVTACVLLALELPSNAVIEELVLRPRALF